MLYWVIFDYEKRKTILEESELKLQSPNFWNDKKQGESLLTLRLFSLFRIICLNGRFYVNIIPQISKLR